jgi:penicillin-binding protein 1A
VVAATLLGSALAATLVLVLAPHYKGEVDAIPTQVRRTLTVHADSYTPLSAISPTMQHAVVALEDRRFYQHHGIDLEGLVRAVWVDVRDRHLEQGGSTITEQLDERTVFQGNTTALREVELLPLAWETENRFTKPQILELYLNDAYFGRGAYGIAAAAQRYFQVAPRQLTPAQAAFLAALPQAPSFYGDHPYAAVTQARWRTALRDLLAQGYISAAQEERALRNGIRVTLPA